MAKNVQNLDMFEKPGGLSTSTHESGKQWDKPYGWAPLHVIAAKGMRNYGFDDDADRVSDKFITLVNDVYNKEGVIKEKYNVETQTSEAKVGYGNQEGFGWTNSAVLILYNDMKKE